MMIRNRTKRIVVAVGFLAALCLALYLGSVYRYQKAVETMRFSNPSLSELPDGSYQGVCDVGFIAAEVEVTIQGERITQINLLRHKNDRGAAAEGILNQMIAEQRLDVDVVAGATNSSKVLHKAVENALIQ